ncbi:MAG: M48 family metallopeptidase [Firmicutes bacterium]|nr:M48 family metallopeptidase [Bacillota bacterium]
MYNISYKLIRQKRKTLTISVVDGNPIVKAPLKLQKEEIDKFVALKSKWIISKIDAYYKRYHRFCAILNGESFILDGQMIEAQYVKTSKIILEENSESNESTKLLIPVVLQQDTQKFAKALKRFFVKLALEKLTQRATYLAGILQANITNISLSNASTRWGSCDAKKNIRLNWRLILLPQYLQDYVIIHELCHSFYLNHSPVFWNLVAHYIPNYKSLKSELKEYSLLIKYLK